MRRIISILAIALIWTMDAFPSPRLQEGVIDITSIGNSAVMMEGELHFYRDKFCDPRKFSDLPEPGIQDLDESESPDYNFDDCSSEEFLSKEMGKPWNPHRKFGLRIPDHGYGTYRFRVLKSSKGLYSIYVPLVATSYKIYVNGHLSGEVGKLGRSEEEAEGYFANYLLPLPKGEYVDIVVHVSNFSHVSSGLWRKWRIGDSSTMDKMFFQSYIVDLFIFGSFFVMAFYHLILFLLRRKDRSNLYFGFFLVILALRSVVTGESILYKYMGMENFTLDWGLRIEFSAFYFGIPFALLYLQSLYPRQIVRWMSLSLIGVFAGVGISTFFLPMKIFTIFTAAMEYLIVIAGIYIIYVAIQAIREKEEDSVLFLTGFAVFFLFVLNDLMFTRYILPTGNYSHVSFYLFVMFQSFFISRRFSKAFHSVEILSENLEKLVEVRTRQYKEEKEKAEIASEWKNKLISLVAHDLRSPLASYYSTLELLEMDSDLSEDEKLTIIQSAKKRVQHSLFSISHLLNLDRFQSGQFSPQFRKIPLSEIWQDLMPSLTGELDTKEQKLTCNYATNTHVYVDTSLFKEIIRNIVLNASKYSPNGTEIRIEESGDDNFVKISVIDQGVGMSQDTIDKILKGSRQDSSRGTAGETGFGIGMSICIELIKAHGGKLAIESGAGNGSKVTVIIPKIQ